MGSDHGEAKSLVTGQVHHAEVQLVEGARLNRALSPLTGIRENSMNKSFFCPGKTVVGFPLHTLYYYVRPVM